MVKGVAGFDLSIGLKNLRYQAGWADKIHGKTIPIGNHFIREMAMRCILNPGEPQNQ